MRDDRERCGRCGAPADQMVPIGQSAREVTWLDGRVFFVQGWRCLSCMARTLVERDRQEAEKELKPVRGEFFPSDGRGFSARLVRTTPPPGASRPADRPDTARG